MVEEAGSRCDIIYPRIGTGHRLKTGNIALTEPFYFESSTKTVDAALVFQVYFN